MDKKINIKLTKLIKYYSLINYNLVYESQSINRYKNKNLIVKTGSAVLNETINGKKQINNGRIIELNFLTI